MRLGGGDRRRRRRAAARAPSRSAARRCRRRRRCRPAAGRGPRGTPPSAGRARRCAGSRRSASRARRSAAATSGLRAISRTRTRTTSGSCRHVRRRIAATCRSCSRAGSPDSSTAWIRSTQDRPVLAEDRLEHLVLRGEVVVEQAVRDAGLLGDVAHARRVEALVREHAHGGVENDAPLLLRYGRTLAPRPSKGSGSVARDATAARGHARRRPDPLPAGRVRDRRAAAPGRARRADRAAGRRPDARDRARLVRRAQRRQGVGRLRPAGRGRRSRGRCSRGRTSCSSRSGPASRPGSASARPTCRSGPSTARSPASGSAGATSSARATTSTTSAGPACSRTRRPRGRRCRSPTSPRARSAP